MVVVVAPGTTYHTMVCRVASVRMPMMMPPKWVLATVAQPPFHAEMLYTIVAHRGQGMFPGCRLCISSDTYGRAAISAGCGGTVGVITATC